MAKKYYRLFDKNAKEWASDYLTADEFATRLPDYWNATAFEMEDLGYEIVEYDEDFNLI